MSYYYLKEDNPFYGSKGNRMSEAIYSKLPLKHKELFSNKKIEEDSSVINKTSSDLYVGSKKDYIGALNDFVANNMNIRFVERDPFEGIMVPFNDDDDNDDQDYENDYDDDDDDDEEGNYEEGW